MTELYKDIRNEVRSTAETSWKIALAQHNPMEAANFLNNVINYYRHFYTEEEIEFLQFYFNMQMEMMKK